MKECFSGRRLAGGLVIGSALLALALFASLPAAAQSEGASAKGSCIGCSVDGKTTPRTADGHPDLSGYWGGGGGGGGGVGGQQFERSKDGDILFDFNTGFNRELCTPTDETPRCLDPNEPPYKPDYLAKSKAIAATAYGGSTPLDPQMDCKPLGVPRTGIGGIEVVQGPQSIAILYEGAPYSLFRIIYTDGRPHPDDLDTSYMGHSIGHWEGDTLVVDVAGLSDETWLGGGLGTQKYATIHSDKEHVVERWTRSGDMLTYEATVDDPVMFTKPWVITPRKVQHHGPSVTSDDGILEQRCTVNDKNHFVKASAEDQPHCNYRCTDPSTGIDPTKKTK
jgi:hypothetical protein